MELNNQNLPDNQEEKKEVNIKLEGETEEEQLADLEKKIPKELAPKDTKFNRLISIIDVRLFKITQDFIMYFVSKYKFKYNKFDIYSKLRLITTIIFLVVSFIFSPLLGFFLGKVLWVKLTVGILNMAIYLVITSFEYSYYLRNKLKSLAYQPIFNSRKNAGINKYIKLRNKIDFIFDKKWRFGALRAEFFVYLFFYSWFLMLVLTHAFVLTTILFAMFIPIHIVNILDHYSDYVFDLDEPEGKKKKVREKVLELTRLMQKAFDELVGRLNPNPVGNQV
jgi:hypothetical protein